MKFGKREVCGREGSVDEWMGGEEVEIKSNDNFLRGFVVRRN